MKEKMFSKALVVGIIVLFIGVGVYPAVSSVPIKTSNILQYKELEAPIISDTSDSEEDCNCKPVSNLHLVRLKRLVNKLVVYNNLLSLLARNNPEVAEISEELSNQVLTLNEIYKKLTDEPFPIICAIIEAAVISLGIIGEFFRQIALYFENNTLIFSIFANLMVVCIVLAFLFIGYAIAFQCE